MKIAICGSIKFTNEMKIIADELTLKWHSVDLPITSKKILSWEITLESFEQENEKQDRKIKDDVIRKYFDIIKSQDAILLVNHKKNGIQGYIWGNTFLEMWFAHVLNKKIYLLNNIPEMSYSDEIRAMQPVVLEGNLSRIFN